MKQGRPIGSPIRQNIVEIMYFLGEGYAYDVYKHYVSIFPKVTMRSIYYHLKKGTEIGEFVVKSVRAEKGDYSWGDRAEKIYYALGPQAGAQVNLEVKKYFDVKSEKK